MKLLHGISLNVVSLARERLKSGNEKAGQWFCEEERKREKRGKG